MYNLYRWTFKTQRWLYFMDFSQLFHNKDKSKYVIHCWLSKESIFERYVILFKNHIVFSSNFRNIWMIVVGKCDNNRRSDIAHWLRFLSVKGFKIVRKFNELSVNWLYIITLCSIYIWLNIERVLLELICSSRWNFVYSFKGVNSKCYDLPFLELVDAEGPGIIVEVSLETFVMNVVVEIST